MVDARPAPRASDISRAIELLRAAERPVVDRRQRRLVVGRGRGAAAVHRAHVVAALHDHDGARRGAGRPPALHGLCRPGAEPRGAARAFQEADLFLVIGKRIDYRLAMGGTRLFPARRTVHPGGRASATELGLNHELDVAICADARLTLEALVAQASRPAPGRPGGLPYWLERVRELRAEWECELARWRSDSGRPLHPAAFFRELRRALPRDVLYAWDGGDFAHWGRASLRGAATRRMAAAGTARHHRLVAAQRAGAATGEPGTSGGGDHGRRRPRLLHRRDGFGRRVTSCRSS